MKTIQKLLISAAFFLPLCTKTALTAEVNYDTAWTFVYDGGIYNENKPVPDVFHDVKPLSDGGYVCVGETRDSTGMRNVLLIKLDENGSKKMVKKYRFEEGVGGYSIIISKGDFIIGGYRYDDPLIMKTDSVGNIKWTTWYYDSINDERKLFRGATVNCLKETSRGTIICAAGDEYPNNNGLSLNNYAAVLELDSAGNLLGGKQWNNTSGYNVGGFYIEEVLLGNIIVSGYQSITCLDSNRNVIWRKKYTMMLDGVGSMVNNIARAKMLRGGSLMVAGQAYEGNCWTKYQRLCFDAWWSPISYAYGTNETWDTAGTQGGSDVIYDFTQLIDGKLVFVGKKASIDGYGGVWTFVTDSTGKNILWERRVRIPYRTADGRAPTPLSVCATPDSGFTVVGEYACVDSIGGMNAFAAYYIPSEPTTVIKKQPLNQSNTAVKLKINGSKVIFSFPSSVSMPVELSVYNAAGKRITEVKSRDLKAEKNSLLWDCSGVSEGIYLYRIRFTDRISTGKLVLKKI